MRYKRMKNPPSTFRHQPSLSEWPEFAIASPRRCSLHARWDNCNTWTRQCIRIMVVYISFRSDFNYFTIPGFPLPAAEDQCFDWVCNTIWIVLSADPYPVHVETLGHVSGHTPPGTVPLTESVNNTEGYRDISPLLCGNHTLYTQHKFYSVRSSVNLLRSRPRNKRAVGRYIME